MSLKISVSVCVCEREREREQKWVQVFEKKSEWILVLIWEEVHLIYKIRRVLSK